jgi:hypothetical protein
MERKHTATADEIELGRWHDAAVAAEAERDSRGNPV